MSQGFLEWYRQNPDMQATPHPEVDATRVRVDCQQAILLNGGDERTLRECEEMMYSELFGCSKAELYQALGIKYGDRQALPTTAQAALTIAEMAATEQIYRDLDSP